MIEKSSTCETMRPFGTDMWRGATYRRKPSGEMGDPCGVSTDPGEEMSGEPWKTRVQVFSERKEDTQSTI